SLTSSYQIFFSKFKHLSGMSGTIMSDKKEIELLYGLECVKVPLHNKDRCIHHNPLYFRNKNEKFNKLINIVKERHSKGQPILIICENEKNTYIVGNILDENNLKHEILNNMRSEEDNIIGQSGEVG